MSPCDFGRIVYILCFYYFVFSTNIKSHHTRLSRREIKLASPNQTRGFSRSILSEIHTRKTPEIETRVSEAKQPKNIPTTSFCFPRQHPSNRLIPLRYRAHPTFALLPHLCEWTRSRRSMPNQVENTPRLSLTPLIRRYGNPLRCQIRGSFSPPFFLFILSLLVPPFLLFFLFFLLLLLFLARSEKFFAENLSQFSLCFGLGCLRVSVRHVAKACFVCF